MSISRSLAVTIWMVASIFYAYQYIIRVMPSIMIKEIMDRYNIDASIFGQFTGIYYIGYSAMHLPIGIMLDRYGPRKIMSICILLTALGVLPLVLSTSWYVAFIGRLLIGVGSSAAILGTFKIIRMSFEEKLFTRMLSISVTIGLVGAIYGGAPVSMMTKVMGYENVVIVFALIGVLLASFTYFIVPSVKAEKTTGIMTDVKMVLTNPRVLLICIFAGLMIGPLEGFADVWGPKFFASVYSMGKVEASYYPSLIFVGMCFGAPVLGFIAEKTRSYMGSIIGSGVVMLIIFALIISTRFDNMTATISLIIVGICCAYQILAIYKASTYVEDRLAGITTAVANMIIMSFGYGFHSLVGYIIDLYGGAQDNQAIIRGISVIPASILIAVIGLISMSLLDRKPKL